MNKKILLGLCGLLCLSCFIGCGDKVNRTTKSERNNRFINTGDKYVIGRDNYYVYYDKITNIVYLIDNEGFGQSAIAGITPLIGKNGLPMLLDEYNKTK